MAVGYTARLAIPLLMLFALVWSVHTRQSTQRSLIRVECNGAACDLVEALALDVWTERRAPGMPFEVVVTRDKLSLLDDFGVTWWMLIPDIDLIAEAEATRLAVPGMTDNWFDEFRDYRAITARMEELAALAPDRVKMEAIGTSIENRPIWALKIGNGKTPMLINGTQHAREWIASMTAICIADRAVREDERDLRLKAFLERTTLWVVPVVNPDGYQYSWSTNRYWRKNRRGGYGVDLNRNWSVAWGGDGSSKNERSDIYRGEYPFSEPETVALRDLAKREKIAIHVDFHTYGQLLLYPWDYTRKPPPDRDRYAGIGDRMASAIHAEHQSHYKLMSGADLYPAAGTMSDWFYGELNAFSYTIELRPRGGSGFVLPPDQIKPTCDEALAGMLEMRKLLD
jgi:carboxypeptidase T